MVMSSEDKVDIISVMEMIPHRYPILLVDRILEYVADQYAVGLKNVTFNEPHFQGHFPGWPRARSCIS
jgi:3-hydroxyacyl-[acyl-carrier-protein] dehydratase